MSEVIYAARKLIGSNLGWFLETRKTIGEMAGRERAININRDVFDEWFPSHGSDKSPIDITTRYFDGNLLTEGKEVIIEDSRTIRMQGGDKNWRLAGDGIKGVWYDVRIGDLLVMAFDRPSATLSWLVLKSGKDASRGVSSLEHGIHDQVEQILGKDNRNMWIVSPLDAARLIRKASKIYKKAGDLLMLDKTMLEEWNASLDKMGFVVGNDVATRLPLSLKAKRFVILSGLSGSGKTLIARAFAKWISDSPTQYEMVAVGANWISNENIVGYPDALDKDRYEKTKALDLIIRADNDRLKPYFLILDEMNLSHVERYFADFLSAIEAPTEPLRFHYDDRSRGDVPAALSSLPENLFIIGTINVDETTYLFSPKVLDRANIIEFRATEKALAGFLAAPVNAKTDSIATVGSGFGKHFVTSANDETSVVIANDRMSSIVRGELLSLFEILAKYNAEFGFRTSSEVLRYVEFSRRANGPVAPEDVDVICRDTLDVQIMQKILTRLHGSRKKLSPILNDLEAFCERTHVWDTSIPSSGSDARIIIKNLTELYNSIEPTSADDAIPFYKLSTEKIKRMKKKLEEGFASYAEA